MRKLKLLLVALDPAHDVGIRLIGKKLQERGHEVVVLPRDTAPEEVVRKALEMRPDYVLVSRTIGYDFDPLVRLIELAEAAGLRQTTKFVVGGRAVRPELAKELGYDAGFGPSTRVEDVVAFIEGVEVREVSPALKREKPDITRGYTYEIRDEEVRSLLLEIARKTLAWAERRTSPGVERARLVFEELRTYGRRGVDIKKYLSLCDDRVVAFYQGSPEIKGVSVIGEDEVGSLSKMVGAYDPARRVPTVRHTTGKPLVFTQFGTGCPVADVMAIKVSEAWGADGVIHFGPAWEARTEGLLSGYVRYSGDGTPTTFENIKLYARFKDSTTLLSVRAHRGLNTPETVVLAGFAGAELTKVNPVYGSIGGGTDPERLVVDAVASLKYAAGFSLPYDIPTNEELAGVPPHKAFAGMLVSAALGLAVGAKPVLKPLACLSPHIILQGYMEDNYVDYNFAKVMALREIIDAPIWPGEPIGFMTHSEDRVQSSLTTAVHAMIMLSAGVDAVTIASSDEAYSGGPISLMARVDTLRAVKEALRALGRTRIVPTEAAAKFKEELKDGIRRVLKEAAYYDNLAEAIYSEVFGTKEEGAYPGRAGRNTVTNR